MSAQSECSNQEKLPDFYETVADDLLEYVGPCDGVWVDVGSGAGALGLAVVSRSARGVLVLLDPDAESLRSGLAAARDRGLAGRAVAIVGGCCAPGPPSQMDSCGRAKVVVFTAVAHAPGRAPPAESIPAMGRARSSGNFSSGCGKAA